jgi:WhiB family redox-sensing transcriptional regulator
LPSEVFFPERGTVVTLGARKVCDGCEVRARCLEYALSHGEWHGTWGGLSVDQRRELVRRGNASNRKRLVGPPATETVNA